uniref:Putative insulin-like peptide 7 n=1 Tax=Magallana gigas TaxID=29159 RepID=K1PRU1_MAGGI
MRHWCCKDEFLCTRQCPKNTNHDNKSLESCIDNNQGHDHSYVMVLVGLSLWTFSWIFTQVKTAAIHYQSYNPVFLQRTEAEWRSLWHNDCHRVCHFELDQHVDLACRMDIYRIRKRSVDAAEEPRISNKYETDNQNTKRIFIDKSTSMKFLSPDSVHSIRRKRNVLNECCYSKGCSWEEFAEFCQFSIRLPATNANSCVS